MYCIVSPHLSIETRQRNFGEAVAVVFGGDEECSGDECSCTTRVWKRVDVYVYDVDAMHPQVDSANFVPSRSF